VPARVPRSPPAVLVTTPAVVRPESVTEVLPVKVVKVPAAAVPPPIAPGLEKVAPFKEEAFRLATLVVEATTNGAVPVARVEVNCPEIVRPVSVPSDVIFVCAALVTVPAVVADPAVVAEVAVAALPPILKLVTGVVEATTNGAVPVARVEVI